MSLILTTAGLAAYAQADASGTKLQATHMAVGDGSGQTVSHTQNSTELVNEVWRGELQEITVAASGEVEFVAHVPLSVGGWYIREVALYADDTLLAIGSHPEIWKPAPESPDKLELVITAPVKFDNAATLSLTVDTTKVLASQEFVTQEIADHNTSGTAHTDIRGLLQQLAEDTPDAATADLAGILELATPAETVAGEDPTRAVTPAGLAAALATSLETSDIGVLVPGIASAEETAEGVEDGKAVTPAGLASLQALTATRYLQIQDKNILGSMRSAISGTWTASVLNTVITNNIVDSTLATNRITLPAGSYYIIAAQTFYKSGRSILRLYDTVADSEVLRGMAIYPLDGGNSFGTAALQGLFTAQQQTEIELQYYVEAHNEWTGIVSPDGAANIMANVEIWRVG